MLDDIVEQKHLDVHSESLDDSIDSRCLVKVMPRSQLKIQSYGVMLVYKDLRYPPIACSENIVVFFTGVMDKSPIDFELFRLGRLFQSATVARLHKALVQSEQDGRPSAIIVRSIFGRQDTLQCVCHRRKAHIFF